MNRKTLQQFIVEDLNQASGPFIAPGSLIHLHKFAEQVSNAYQADPDDVVLMITKELNFFGYELDSTSLENGDADKGTEDFFIIECSTGEIIKNAFVSLTWEKGQTLVYDWRPGIQQFRVTVKFIEVPVSEMMDLLAIANGPNSATKEIADTMSVTSDLKAEQVFSRKRLVETSIPGQFETEDLKGPKEFAPRNDVILFTGPGFKSLQQVNELIHRNIGDFDGIIIATENNDAFYSGLKQSLKQKKWLVLETKKYKGLFILGDPSHFNTPKSRSIWMTWVEEMVKPSAGLSV